MVALKAICPLHQRVIRDLLQTDGSASVIVNRVVWSRYGMRDLHKLSSSWKHAEVLPIPSLIPSYH